MALQMKSAEHDAAVFQIRELQEELKVALPLAGWKLQAEDVLIEGTVNLLTDTIEPIVTPDCLRVLVL